MKIGILGVGHLGGALAEGYANAGMTGDVILSPRGRERSTLLRSTYGFEVAEDNVALVRACDVVLVSTRPDMVTSTIQMLPWREGQVLISAAAGITTGSLRGAVAPADVVRSMPVLASALNQSAIPIYPEHPAAIKALLPLGYVTPIKSEDAFSSVSALGAWFGWLFALAGSTADNLIEAGVDPQTARKVTADMMRAAGAMIADHPDRDPHDTLTHLATPGGITEVGLKTLKDSNALEPWGAAMDAAMKKLQTLGRS